MKLKFLIFFLPVILFGMSQEEWYNYSSALNQAKQAEQDYQFMQNLEYERKQNKLKKIENNRLRCDRNKMLQIEAIFDTSVCTNNNNQNFEKRYLKCTLIQEDCNDISLRMAKTKNKFDKDLILLETEINFYPNSKGYAPSTYEFKCSGSNVDIYSDYSKTKAFLNEKNQFILYNPYYSIKDKESLFIYQCREATFFEKMKMKIDK